MNKSELVNWLQDQNQQFQALLDEIGPTRMEQPGVSGYWSMKDIVAHLTGWDRWVLARFQAAQRGEPEPLPLWSPELKTDDGINAWIYESYRGHTLSQVLEETDQVHQQILAVIRALPDNVKIETVEPAYYLVWLGEKRYQPGEFFDHFRDDHEADVRAWLARQKK